MGHCNGVMHEFARCRQITCEQRLYKLSSLLGGGGGGIEAREGQFQAPPLCMKP